MKYENVRDTLTVAQKLLVEGGTSKEKIESLQKLLKGIDPTLDRAIGDLTTAWTKIGKLQKGEILELSLEALPEDSEKDRKRKKAILLFIKSWKDLKSEVNRVKKELQASQGQAVRAGRIAAMAKGPFGIITAVAVVLVIVGVLLKGNTKSPQTSQQINPTPKTIKVIDVNSKTVALSEFIIGTGADCDSPHYHAPGEGTVTALDGTKLQDPGNCGFGKVKDVSIHEITY